jgi:transcription initiation factor TFIID TATA-box-binding protein
MSEFEIKVENVVAFTSLGKDISLTSLVEKIEDVEYEPEQFPGLVYRIQDPRAAALIFSSGKIVCTGARSIEMSKEAMHKVVDRVRETGVDLPRQFDIKVENIVASSKIDAKLNLEEIAFSLENAEYEPEQFPGLVYRIREPRVAFLLFSSGKIICTGAHTLSDVQLALKKLKAKLEEIGIKVGTGKESQPKADAKESQPKADAKESQPKDGVKSKPKSEPKKPDAKKPVKKK